MKVTYKRSVSESLMLVKETDSETFDEFSLKMITINDLKGFLKPEAQRINGSRELVYDISGKYSLNNMFELKRMSARDLEMFCSSLKQCIRLLEEYLLPSDILILDPEFIYWDNNKACYYFCAFPYVNMQTYEVESNPLADLIISCIDYDDQELVKKAYQINMAMNSVNFSLGSIADLIEEWKVRDETECMPVIKKLAEERNEGIPGVCKEHEPNDIEMHEIYERKNERVSEDKLQILRSLGRRLKELF